jgi:uncharacterized tellurite resistance protein B-like protein
MNQLKKFKNLLVMAMADGGISEREIKFLSERRERWGLSDSQFAEAVQFALNNPGQLEIPQRRSERIEMLQDLIRTMAADGQLSEVEKRVFATAAAVMEISSDDVNRLIDDLLLKVERQREPQK